METTKTYNICSVKDCEMRAKSRGFCIKHYRRLVRNGHTTALRSHWRIKEGTPQEKFWARVALTADDQRCWEWQACKHKRGYGTSFFDGKVRKTHRIAWFLTHGVWPQDCLLHSCDNPSCVNPNHLREGTHADNSRDKILKNRQAVGAAVKRGHLTDADIVSIRQRAVRYKVTQQSLAEEYNVCRRTIGDIVNRHSWRHVLSP